MSDIRVTVWSAGKKYSVDMPRGGELPEALRRAGVYVAAVCGGRGTCGKCRVRVVEGALAVTAADSAVFSREETEAGWRLGCLARPSGDITLDVPSADDGFEAVVGFAKKKVRGRAFGGARRPRGGLSVRPVHLAKARESFGSRVAAARGGLTMGVLRQLSQIGEGGPDAGTVYAAYSGGRLVHVGRGRAPYYGVAVDIGTTTLGFALVDMESGRVLHSLSYVNRQREYGADVISRIMHSNGGGGPAMTAAVRAQLAQGVAELCGRGGVAGDRLLKIAVAGNTTMLHLLLGLSCRTLGAVPFTPVTLEALTFNYRELFDGDYSCPVDIMPGFSAYVGADITAGVLATGIYKSEKPAFLLDVGTNGEMAVAFGGRILCTSTAAGPALEGGKLQCGTGSVQGAISSVRREGGAFAVQTIGGAPPVGICGSGVVEAVWRLLEAGLISPTGRMAPAAAGAGVKLADSADGGEIVFTQKDVREVQLGKSAIRSGIDLLMARAGLTCADIGVMYLAGGFGTHLNVEACAAIGLFPGELVPRIEAVGNSALGGAVRWLLHGGARALAGGILARSSEFNLAEDKDFNKMFIGNMNFM